MAVPVLRAQPQPARDNSGTTKDRNRERELADARDPGVWQDRWQRGNAPGHHVSISLPDKAQKAPELSVFVGGIAALQRASYSVTARSGRVVVRGGATTDSIRPKRVRAETASTRTLTSAPMCAASPAKTAIRSCGVRPTS